MGGPVSPALSPPPLLVPPPTALQYMILISQLLSPEEGHMHKPSVICLSLESVWKAQDSNR